MKNEDDTFLLPSTFKRWVVVVVFAHFLINFLLQGLHIFSLWSFCQDALKRSEAV
jgi:hypothetical protein